jgi:hypothetical protein
MLSISYYVLYFLFNKIGEPQGRTGSAQKQWGEGRVTQTMYTQVNKCKNNKIKEREKKNPNMWPAT